MAYFPIRVNELGVEDDPLSQKLLCPDASEVDNSVHRLLHSGQRRILVATMEVHATSEDVGAWKTHEREA